MKTIEEFSKTYEALGDAVLKDVSISFKQNPAQLVIKVIVDCMSALKDYEWVYLEFIFYDVKEFNISSALNGSIEVVESFSVLHLDDLLIFNFAPNIIPPETIAEHRDSRFYLICKEFDFQEILSKRD